jgi:hypothetical protein
MGTSVNWAVTVTTKMDDRLLCGQMRSAAAQAGKSATQQGLRPALDCGRDAPIGACQNGRKYCYQWTISRA